MRKVKLLLFVSLSFLGGSLFGQVTLAPANASSEDIVTINFDATGTSLATEATIYVHAGVVTKNTASPTGPDWANVKGNWGKDDGIGKMTAITGQSGRWKLELTPNLRSYFGVAQGTPIFWLALVFRNANGSKQTSPDIFVKLTIPNSVSITSPSSTSNQLFVEQDQSIKISAEASSVATSLELLADVGSGFQTIASTSNATSVQVDYIPIVSGTITIKAKAVFGSINAETTSTYTILFRAATVIQDLPAGLKDGINYFTTDLARAALVLLAPNKQFVYAVGDFNNWQISDSYLMKKTPDGKRFWLELNGLQSTKEYIFQYWVEGTIKVGDPLADKISDPFNDSSIPATTYPNLIGNTQTDNGIATTLQTGQTPFSWSVNEASYVPPAKDELLVYELLLRDFIGSRRYKDLADSLNYFKRLGINTIELMPIMEFEGNLSWGYNPSYFLAPDKIYGTKNDLKTLIDKAHQNGIAIVLDIALNHAFGQNAMVKMYWDKATNKPSADNPWFNTDATHPYNVGYDFNHESLYTKAFVDTVTSYWLREYHVDGFRFDLSKGFTQKKSGSDVGVWSAYDQSRIDIWDRISKKIFSVNPKAIIILEHFAAEAEEANLASKGMVLWRNLNSDFREVLKGNTTQSFGNALAKTHVSYMESHDEERTSFDMLTNGRASDTYTIKDKLIALDRLKMAATFLYTLPGSKMLWQFQELGYDKSINACEDGTLSDNCRLSNKPLVWGNGSLNYYSDSERQNVFGTFAAINKLVNANKDVFKNGNTSWKSSGDTRTITIKHDAMDVAIVGNFSTATASVNPNFSKAGSWFDFFSGETVKITDPAALIQLTPGEFHIFTTAKQFTPKTGLVTGAEEQRVSSTPVLYPNPTSDKVYISFGVSSGNLKISFRDLIGKEIDQLSEFYYGEPLKLDVTRFKRGIYLVTLQLDNGQRKTIKLLIED